MVKMNINEELKGEVEDVVRNLVASGKSSAVLPSMPDFLVVLDGVRPETVYATFRFPDITPSEVFLTHTSS